MYTRRLLKAVALLPAVVLSERVAPSVIYSDDEASASRVAGTEEVSLPIEFEGPQHEQINRRLRRGVIEASGSKETASLEEGDEESHHDSPSEGVEEVSLPIEFAPPQAEETSRKLRRTASLQDAPEKGYFRDDSIPLVEGPHLMGEEGRKLQTCNNNEKPYYIELVTDNYGYEISWELITETGQLVSSGPPYNTKYADNTLYKGFLCLTAGNYVFIVKDANGDGIWSQTYGEGKYKLYLNGVLEYESPTHPDEFAKRIHPFSVTGIAGTPRTNCKKVTVELKIDQYQKETSWTIRNSGGNTVMSLGPVLDSNEYRKVEKCLPPGDYTFSISDPDGVCCRYGQGFYTISVDGWLLISGGSFQGSESHKIKVGYNYYSQMSDRDREWLTAHNSRRLTWHQRFGKEYNPLRWSNALAVDAKSWADKLLDDCDKIGIIHEPGVSDGENLAKNKGTGSYGKRYPADNIVRRWVEFEEDDPWPKNAHLTQALWLPSDYLGCGEGVKIMLNGMTCHIQVCRYVKAGNCAMGQFNGNWQAAVFQDDSGCGRQCPTEGCFAP